MAITVTLHYHVAMGNPGSCPQDVYNDKRHSNSNNMKKLLGVIQKRPVHFCGTQTREGSFWIKMIVGSASGNVAFELDLRMGMMLGLDRQALSDKATRVKIQEGRKVLGVFWKSR